jgi:hypothetical protein
MELSLHNKSCYAESVTRNFSVAKVVLRSCDNFLLNKADNFQGRRIDLFFIVGEGSFQIKLGLASTFHNNIICTYL